MKHGKTYRTPRSVAEFAARAAVESPRIAEPAAGSGAFLADAIGNPPFAFGGAKEDRK